ncbi:MAG: 4Fe-4S dicluster domain-containing protein [Acidimicrobiia bacterium]
MSELILREPQPGGSRDSRIPEPPSPVSRRQFLHAMGAAGIVVATGGPVLKRVLAAADLDAYSVDPGLAEHRWVMVFDLRRCDGCGDCIKGCQIEHFLPAEQRWIKVYELEDAQGQPYAMPVLCMQCENAPCVRVCPSRATYHQTEGAVVVDQDICIGCRMCMAACPYDVRVFNWDRQPPVPGHEHNTPEFRVPQKQGTVGKCTMCVHLLRDGRLPACLEACSMKAIYVGDLVEDTMTNGRENYVLSQYLRQNDAFRFKSELGTRPRVYYVAGHGQDLDY